MDHCRSSNVKIIPIIVVLVQISETVPILPMAVLTGGLVPSCESAGGSVIGNPTVGNAARASEGSNEALEDVGDSVDVPKGDGEGKKLSLGTFEGRADGIAEGKAEGIAEGIAEGKAEGKVLPLGLETASGDVEVEGEKLIVGLLIEPSDVEGEGDELILGLEKASGLEVMLGNVDGPLGATTLGSPTPGTVGVVVNAGGIRIGFGGGASDGESGNLIIGVEGTEGSDGAVGWDGAGGGEGGRENLGIDVAVGFFGDLDFP